jgi:hypothetical protein
MRYLLVSPTKFLRAAMQYLVLFCSGDADVAIDLDALWSEIDELLEAYVS